MALQRCLGYNGQRCGRLVEGRRCDEHERMLNRSEMAARRVRRPGLRKDQDRRAQAVRDHVATNGMLCPGWGRPPHLVAKLTADHVLAVAAGGAETGELQALCPSCNSAKQHH